MKYLDLFSGAGGFRSAFEQIPDTEYVRVRSERRLWRMQRMQYLLSVSKNHPMNDFCHSEVCSSGSEDCEIDMHADKSYHDLFSYGKRVVLQ